MRRVLTAALFSLLAIGVAEAAPSVADILAANRTAAGGPQWDSKETLLTSYAYSGQGMTGTTHSTTDLKTGNFADDFAIGPATGANGFDGKDAWAKDPTGTVTLQQGGDARAIAVSEAYRRANLWWATDRGGAAISAAQKSENGTNYDALTVKPKDGNPFEAWFDPKTHQLVRIIEKQGSQTITSTLSDYASYDGLMMAKSTVIDDGNGEKYRQTLTLTKAECSGKKPVALYGPPKVSVNDYSIAGNAKETTLPIQIINNHIYGQTMVNGKGPFIFIFDTGGHNLLTPATAKLLGLKTEGAMAANGAGEGTMEAGFTKVKKIEVGGAAVSDQVFTVLPLDALANIEGTEMPGMIGFELFRRFVTRIDYGAKTLTLINPKNFDPKDAGTPIKFTFNEHIPEVTGTFEGLPAKYDIDTGSRSELTLTKPFAEKNDLRAKHPKGVDAVEGWGVGGPSRAYVTRGTVMTIGPITIDGVVTSLSTQKKGAFSGEDYQGNIGGGILKRFVVTFDYEHQMMYLKPLPRPVADIGTFDRSGMWLNKVGAGFQIADVTLKGPAELAGLKADDVISAVDGKPATSIALYDLRKRLRNDPPGTRVTFTIKREDKTRDVVVTLKDQI